MSMPNRPRVCGAIAVTGSVLGLGQYVGRFASLVGMYITFLDHSQIFRGKQSAEVTESCWPTEVKHPMSRWLGWVW